jgi:hypothetical protein
VPQAHRGWAAVTGKVSLRFSAALLAFLGLETSALSQPAADQISSYSDQRCPFVVRFDAKMMPASTRSDGVTTTTVLAQGLRISVACIPNPGARPSAPFEDGALHNRLAMLAAALGISQPVIRVPVPPAASCGLIEGTIAPGRVPTRVRTEFCYGPNAYLIVETTTDASPRADDAVSGVLASIAVRTDNPPKVENGSW